MATVEETPGLATPDESDAILQDDFGDSNV